MQGLEVLKKRLVGVPGQTARSSSGSEATEARRLFRAQVVLFWILAIALPVAVLINMEFWLQSSYTSGVFHRAGFLDQYGSGIYRYRILGRIALLKTYDLLRHVVPQIPFPMPRDAEAELPFVLAYAVWNGVCLFFANLLLLTFLWSPKKGFRMETLALYFFTFLLLAVSMAVVTPYDQLAYLLLVLAVFGVKIRHPTLSYSCVAVSAVAGMLNRETEFLASALLLTAALFTSGVSSRRFRRFTAVHLSLCLMTYLVLRLTAPGHASVANGLTFGGKWAAPSAAILVALTVATTVLVQPLYASVRPALVFLLLSLPYLLLVLLTGALRELRLLVPVVLCLFCLYELLDQEHRANDMSGSTG